MEKDLQGKIAWVTGSSRGIGRRIAERLAEAGSDVAISGRNQTNLQSSGEGTSVDDVATEIARSYLAPDSRLLRYRRLGRAQGLRLARTRKGEWRADDAVADSVHGLLVSLKHD